MLVSAGMLAMTLLLSVTVGGFAAALTAATLVPVGMAGCGAAPAVNTRLLTDIPIATPLTEAKLRMLGVAPAELVCALVARSIALTEPVSVTWKNCRTAWMKAAIPAV